MERVADPSPPTRPTSPRSWRPLILRLHFYAGILVAPFILIATISGGLYAVAPTIEQLMYRDYLHVDATGPAVPVAGRRQLQGHGPHGARRGLRCSPKRARSIHRLFT